MIPIYQLLKAASRSLITLTPVRRVSTTGSLFRSKEVKNCRKVDCSNTKERVKARKIPGCEEPPSTPKNRLCRPVDPCTSHPKRKINLWEYFEKLNLLLAVLLLGAYMTYYYLRRRNEMAIDDIRMKINKLDNKLKQLEGKDDDQNLVDGNKQIPANIESQKDDKDNDKKTVNKIDETSAQKNEQKPVMGDKTSVPKDEKNPVQNIDKPFKPDDQKSGTRDSQKDNRKDNQTPADKAEKGNERRVKPGETDEDIEDN